jgi:hypothetical protein
MGLVCPGADLGDGLDLFGGKRRHRMPVLRVPLPEHGAVVLVLDGDDPMVAVQVRTAAKFGVSRLVDPAVSVGGEVGGVCRRRADDCVDADDVVVRHRSASVLALPHRTRHSGHHSHPPRPRIPMLLVVTRIAVHRSFDPAAG